MLTLELDMYQACALGALVYCLGRLLVQKLPFLSKYCIPAPVAGGVVFAFAHLLFTFFPLIIRIILVESL